MSRSIAILSVYLLLAACAATPPRPTDPDTTRCLELYSALDQAVAEHGATPSSPVRVADFPYLRVDRFLSSFRDQLPTTAARDVWVDQLVALDRDARQIELASLPPLVIADLTGRYAAPASLTDALASCAQRLQNQDLRDPERLEQLRQQAQVPDDYQTGKRLFGLYPLTALPVSAGIARWHEETRQTFAQPLEQLPVKGQLQRFVPPDKPTVFSGTLFRDELDIPNLTPQQLATLFAAHAPVWEIDVAGDYDLPGAPYWRQPNQPGLNTLQPVVYRYPSYTRWQGRVLLQLNYGIWFSERPRTGSLDILSGLLDGILWRVTLDPAGRPLLYDTIHHCGCYHLFFPGPTLQLRATAEELPESPLAPQPLPSLKAKQRLVIRISSGDHYLQRVYGDVVSSGKPYVWHDYQALYAVPDGGGRRSLFDANGLVAGTQRGERWLLWPMGVSSPGAMRERGRHVTAFLGRRHFDDADLLEKLFEPVRRNDEQVPRQPAAAVGRTNAGG